MQAFVDTLLPRLKARVARDSGNPAETGRPLALELSSGHSMGALASTVVHHGASLPLGMAPLAQAVPLNVATREQLQAEVVALRQEMQLQGSSMREQLLVSALIYTACSPTCDSLQGVSAILPTMAGALCASPPLPPVHYTCRPWSEA